MSSTRRRRPAIAALFALALVHSPGLRAQDRQVLPDGVLPLHYDVLLSPDAEALTFRGAVGIDLDVRAATSEVILNAEGLDFDRVALDGSAPESVSFEESIGRARLRFSRPVAPGRHRLEIAYHGAIGRSTFGFFAMDYRTKNGPRRTLATNIEPAGARQFLPCWDEPGRKATFTVTLDAPADRMALSNMPIEEETPLGPNLRRVRFAPTPKMSTYLLFVGIGDYERISTTVAGVDVGVVVQPGDGPRAAFALAEAGRLLRWYDDYFGTPYPLPKLDLIAAPGKIEGGSMENWGAIFYSQDHLLVDPVSGTEAERQEVFLVVSHEMAHQWFGNLVTMAWWDDLWLNEGFARWMQTYVADALHPEWGTGLKAFGIYERGKSLDALPSTHPVVQRIDTVEQAGLAFDFITYDKGAAVIRMLIGAIGPETFREGLQRYMKKHAFGNTVDTDLWSVMQEVAGQPILGIVRDFTRQPGLPLVRVASVPDGIRLEQSRFFAEPEAGAPAQRWKLPLEVRFLDGEPRQLLLEGSAELPRPALVNAGQTAYARVLYDEPLFSSLLARLPGLDAADQRGLIEDTVALGLAGAAPASRILALAERLPVDADPLVWSSVVGSLGSLDRRWGDTPQRAAFRRFARNVLTPLAEALGEETRPGEPVYAATLRGEVAGARAAFDDAEVVASARRLFREGGGDAERQQAALEIVAAHADRAMFEALLARARAATDPLEKQRLYLAMAGVEDPELARRMLVIALGDEVPAGTGRTLLGPLAARHPDLAWREVVPHLAGSTTLDRRSQWRIAGMLASDSADPARIDELRAWISANVPPEARQPFEGDIASIRNNRRIADEILPEIDRWLAGRKGAAAGG